MTLGIGTGALVAGLFGMNVCRTLKLTFVHWWSFQLLSQLEQHHYAFYMISAAAASIALGIGLAGLRRCCWLVSWSQCKTDGGFTRLAKIRKVGLSSSNSKRPPRESAWLPLPLRNRTPGGWSWQSISLPSDKHRICHTYLLRLSPYYPISVTIPFNLIVYWKVANPRLCSNSANHAARHYNS